MAKEFAAAFYKSQAWIECRTGYAKSVGGLCERCIKRGAFRPGEIVHHKIRLTPENIMKPEISLNWANLELLCIDCHNKEHGAQPKRYSFDENGKVTPPRSKTNFEN